MKEMRFTYVFTLKNRNIEYYENMFKILYNKTLPTERDNEWLYDRQGNHETDYQL